MECVYKYDVGLGGALAESMVFPLEGRGFESHSNRHVGTLGKSLTCSCLSRFGL